MTARQLFLMTSAALFGAFALIALHFEPAGGDWLLLGGLLLLLVGLLYIALCGVTRHLERELAARNDELRLLNKRLAQLAGTDPLTNLANRRHFSEALEREVTRARRSGDPVSVLLVGINGFEELNERYSYLAGNEVLQRLATLLTDLCRGYDLTGRWDGKTFAVMLPGTPLLGAEGVADRLREAVTEQPAVTVGRDQFGFSVAIEIAELAVGEGSDRLLERASQALSQQREPAPSAAH